MIKPFLDENFLLNNSVAEKLFHDYAEDLPIIDYHNHLPPDEIAEDKMFQNITEAWLKGDHYKWRAMRANGVNEKYITGNTGDQEKFTKWAETVPYTMRNPLYHWTHLELQRYFNISRLLDNDSCNEIYEETSHKLQSASYSVKSLLKRMKVEVVCTTDHPTDDLQYHKSELSSNSNDLKMLPTFRPDRFLGIRKSDFIIHLEKLEQVSGIEISSFSDLINALKSRIDFFQAHGCKLADHGLSQLYPIHFSEKEMDLLIRKKKDGGDINPEEAASFQMGVLYELCKFYFDKKWTVQFHLGALRDNNDRLFSAIGADAGTDSIGDYDQAVGLSFFLNYLDKEGRLPQTILYNLNPRDNEVFATMVGNFNDGSMPGKIQWGSAWWFLDQKDGMEKQINTLSNMGLLSRFIGMLTDSRSFLSMPRHEYFRRILCNLIGQDVHNGELPHDLKWLGGFIQDICYNNAQKYFKF